MPTPREKSLDEMFANMEASAARLGLPEAEPTDEPQTPEDRASMEERVKAWREGRGNAPNGITETQTSGVDAEYGTSGLGAESGPEFRPGEFDDQGFGTSGLGREQGTSGLGAEAGPEFRPGETDGPEFGTSGLGAEQGPELRPDALKPAPQRAARAPAPMRPAAPPPKPRAPGQPPDWDDLLARAKSGAILDDVVNAGNHALSRYSAAPPVSHSSRDIAALPLAMAKERQAYEGRAESQGSARMRSENEAALNDPASPASARIRESVKAMLGDALSPEQVKVLDQMNGKEAKEFVMSPELALARQQKQPKDAAAAKAKADAAAKKSADASVSTEQLRARISEEFGIEPDKLSGLSSEDLGRLVNARSAKANQGIARAGLAIRQTEAGEKQSARDALQEGIPFLGKVLKPRGGRTPREDETRKAQDNASDWSAAFGGMDSLKQALSAYGANPSVDTKREVESQVIVASTALNKALGQGAQAENEAKRINAALGADLASGTGVQATLQGLFGDEDEAIRTLTTRLGAVRKASEAAALGKLKTLNYEFEGSGQEAGGNAKTRRMKNGGTAYQGRKSGKWFTTPEEAEAN